MLDDGIIIHLLVTIRQKRRIACSDSPDVLALGSGQATPRQLLVSQDANGLPVYGPSRLLQSGVHRISRLHRDLLTDYAAYEGLEDFTPSRKTLSTILLNNSPDQGIGRQM